MPEGYRLLDAGYYRLLDGAGPYAWDGSTFALMGSGRGAVGGVAPVLSGISPVDFSDVFVWGQVTTDTASGTLYAVVVGSVATTPSAAQIIAGTDAAGAAAPNASVAITSTGAKQVLVQGLTAATTYKVCMTHAAAGGNSNVLTAAFTTDTLVLAVLTNGTNTGISGASTGSAALTAVADPYGGTNALHWVDVNDAVSPGSVLLSQNATTFFNGLNKHHITVKYVSGAQWMRIAPSTMTVTSSVYFNIVTGAIGTETWTGTPVMYDLGSGWQMFSGVIDLTGADVIGFFTLLMTSADNVTTAASRNGTNIRDIYNSADYEGLMTVQIDRRSKTHRGNGIATVFPYDFPIPDAESVRVYLFNETNNSRTDLSDAQYNITGLGEDDFGSVTYPLVGSPIPATTTLTVAREVPYTQELDIHNQGGFYPEVLEDQLDLMVMQTQQVKTEAAGALRAQLGETFNRLPAKSSLANKYLKFDGTGEPVGATEIALGSATFATEAEARAGTSTSVLMSPLRTFQAIDERTRNVFPEDFIGDATDFSSITAGLQTFFNTLAAEGGIGRLSQWYPINGPIVIASVAQPFVIEGVGRYVSGLRRAGAAEFTVLDVTGDEFVLRDFGVDGGRSTFASTSEKGIRVSGSRWQITNVHVRDCSGMGIAAEGSGVLGTVRNCHVDGTGGAEYGIALTAQIGGVVDGCFVENVHNSANNVGIQLAGCSETVVANSRVRNCFTSVQVIGAGSNNHVSDVLITSPNSSSSSGSVATGVWLAGGSALSCNDLSIDGGNQPGFLGVLIDNDPDGGAAVALRASNCAGTDSYVLKVLDTSYSLVTIASVFNVRDLFVHLVGTTSTNNTILLGRKEGTPIYAPWRHVQNDAEQLSNLVQLLSGDITQTVVLDDDEAVFFPVIDGVFGLLEVSTPHDAKWFRGTVNFSASPQIFGHVGADCTVGTTALTTGTSNGVDGNLNIAVTLDKLYIKNRAGFLRQVIFRLVMA